MTNVVKIDFKSRSAERDLKKPKSHKHFSCDADIVQDVRVRLSYDGFLFEPDVIVSVLNNDPEYLHVVTFQRGDQVRKVGLKYDPGSEVYSKYPFLHVIEKSDTAPFWFRKPMEESTDEAAQYLIDVGAV
jgi:hypothetical protein